MRIIAGKWKSRRLAPPPGGVRPTADRVREAWMSIVAGSIGGAAVGDLFAGSGALGLEALSRGAARATFVERGRAAMRALERNARSLNAGSSAVLIKGDAIKHARALEADHYDLAFADPPYGRGFVQRLAACYRRRPFARELWIEHHAAEAPPGEAAAERRRYGDTVLTRLARPGEGRRCRPAGDRP